MDDQDRNEDPTERGVQGQQQDQRTAKDRAADAVDTRPAVEVSLASGGQVTGQDIAVSSGLATREEAEAVHTAGMTLPSVPTQAGVASDGSTVDGRRDKAMDFHRAVLGEKEVDDDFEVAPGVTRKMFRESSMGRAQEGSREDNRRVMLSDDGSGLVHTATVSFEKQTEVSEDAGQDNRKVEETVQETDDTTDDPDEG